MQSSFPIYILKLHDEYQIVISEGQKDMAHIDFWEQTVADIVAAHYQLPVNALIYLPYCQQRARIYKNRIYYGEEQQPLLLATIKLALNNDNLAFFYDEHERRLLYDVLQFEALLKTL